MNTAEIVVREMQRDSSLQMRQLFSESIRQPRQPAKLHPHSEILTFHIRRADMVGIGIAWRPRFAPRFFGALTSATLPSASGLGHRRRGFPLCGSWLDATLITFGTLRPQAAGLHFAHGLHYHQNQIPLHAMRADRGEVSMRKVLLLVPKSD